MPVSEFIQTVLVDPMIYFGYFSHKVCGIPLNIIDVCYLSLYGFRKHDEYQPRDPEVVNIRSCDIFFRRGYVTIIEQMGLLHAGAL